MAKPSALEWMQGKDRAPRQSDPTVLSGGSKLGIFWKDCKNTRRCGRPPYDRLLSNPVLDIAFRLPEGGGSTVIEAELGAELIKILQRPRRISAADAALRSASAKAVSSALAIVQQTQQHYFDAVALRRETQILTERKERIGELLKVAEARLAAGEGTQLDVATLKAEQATAEIDLQEGNRKLKATQLALAHRLGQPSGHVSWQLSTLLKTQIALRKEPDVIAHGLRVRPEIQADRWQLAALEDGAALARRRTGFLAIHLGIHAVQITALGEIGCMSPIGAADDILRP